MKITLDSSEPLEDAVRVIGSLYGVTLVVSNGEPETTKPVQTQVSKPAKRKTKRTRPTAATKVRTRVVAAEADAGESNEQTTPSQSVASPSNAEVRSWARQNGLKVSDRGRVPASVLAAYRSAHDE